MREPSTAYGHVHRGNVLDINHDTASPKWHTVLCTVCSNAARHNLGSTTAKAPGPRPLPRPIGLEEASGRKRVPLFPWMDLFVNASFFVGLKESTHDSHTHTHTRTLTHMSRPDLPVPCRATPEQRADPSLPELPRLHLPKSHIVPRRFQPHRG
jgi:hypothetical protein